MTRLVLLLLLGAACVLSPPGARAADASAFCAASPTDYFLAEDQDCSLTWKGVTLYGAVDAGAGYQTHGVPFNRYYPNGVEELISKNSNKALFVPLPNGLGQSNVGIKGDERLNGDLAFIFNLQTGFDPYSMQLANGPKSLVQNNANVLSVQNANGDSSLAGQVLNTVAYAGVSHPLFGALTAGRQDSLILDSLAAYDPMQAAPAFSVIGASNTAAGVGDTEDARYATSLQYRVNVGNLRFATLYQIGGYDWGNGANGAIEALIGADVGNLSVEAVGNRVKDAVSLSNYATWPLPPGVTIDNLKATLSDNTSGMLMAKYTFSRFKFYAGFEYIQFQNPSDAYPYG
jgi:predicted porin